MVSTGGKVSRWRWFGAAAVLGVLAAMLSGGNAPAAQSVLAHDRKPPAPPRKGDRGLLADPKFRPAETIRVGGVQISTTTSTASSR